MHNEALNGHSIDDTTENTPKKADKKIYNGNKNTVPINNDPNGLSLNGLNNNENEPLAPHGDSHSASFWKPSSRRSSSDGAIKAVQGSVALKPERGHSFSDSDEKTAALKAKIHQKYDELEKEMAAKACANGLTLNSPTSEAVLQLGDRTTTLLSPDPRYV